MKRCPYCSEKVHNEAKKCKHCGEWLEETILGEITDIKTKKSTNPITRFFKYLWFFVLSFLVIGIAEAGIGLLVAIFAYIGLLWIIFLGTILFGLLYTGIGYITIFIFRIIPNKEIGRIIFIILLILLTIATLIQIWGFVSDADLPRDIKVVDSIGQIILCIALCVGSENLSEGTLGI